MNLTAVILCGGEGTRLRPITYEIPKSLITVHDKSLVEHIIDLLKKYQITEIILSVGYMKEKIKDYFGDGKKFNVNISYVEEETPLGTAGPLNLLDKLNRLPQNSFILSNGDELKDININKMFEVHKRNRALATIALTNIEDPSDWGVVRLDREKILEFVEKPKENPPSNLINSGLYILEPDIVKLIPEGNVSIEREVFPKIASQGRLYGYQFTGQWFPTDNPERLKKAISEWKGIR